MSSLSPATTGESEVKFIAALLSGEPASTVHDILSEGIRCQPDNELPGSSRPPDWYDIDGFAILLRTEVFAEHAPLSFNVSLGGRSIPDSCKVLRAKAGLVFIGSANSNLYLLIPEDEYDELFWTIRAALPSPVNDSEVSHTREKTHTMEALIEAMKESKVSHVVVLCYGLEDKLSVDEAGKPVLKPHQLYISQWAESSLGFRVDVAAVWLEEGATHLISIPGRAPGVRVFPVGVPLQSLTHFMRHLSSTPPQERESAARAFAGGGWRGGTISASSTFLRAKNATFPICDAPSGSSFSGIQHALVDLIRLPFLPLCSALLCLQGTDSSLTPHVPQIHRLLLLCPSTHS